MRTSSRTTSRRCCSEARFAATGTRVTQGHQEAVAVMRLRYPGRRRAPSLLEGGDRTASLRLRRRCRRNDPRTRRLLLHLVDGGPVDALLVAPRLPWRQRPRACTLNRASIWARADLASQRDGAPPITSAGPSARDRSRSNDSALRKQTKEAVLQGAPRTRRGNGGGPARATKARPSGTGDSCQRALQK